MALVIKDEPLTFKRVRASVVYRLLGATPRGSYPAVDLEIDELRRQLDAKQDEVALLRLELDVDRSEDRHREDRLDAIERRLDESDQALREHMGSMRTTCSYLVRDIDRLLELLRARS